MMKKYREAYFSLLDSVTRDTGNSKYGLHEDWKNRIFPFLIEDPTNFVDEIIPGSFTTVTLSSKGWETFYTEWRHFCIEFFNISN